MKRMQTKHHIRKSQIEIKRTTINTIKNTAMNTTICNNVKIYLQENVLHFSNGPWLSSLT